MAMPFGNVRTVRARGMKFKLSSYSVEQLEQMHETARIQRDEMETLRQAVEHELAVRSGKVQASRFSASLRR